MATKKTLRGAALVNQAIAMIREKGLIPSPEPLAAAVLKKLRLPNDEKLSPGLKTFLAFDVSMFNFSFDEEDPEFDVLSLDEFVDEAMGEDAVPFYREAYDLLTGDCIAIGEHQPGVHSFLYVGDPDSAGEYAVVSLLAGSRKVFGFVPFDAWVAQSIGALPATLGEDYQPFVAELAQVNGDGRTEFECDPDHKSDGDEFAMADDDEEDEVEEDAKE
jgi:hypothetical protein